jgi:integrase/recombinase XerD
MEKEFELFLREKRFVSNASKHTIEFYKRSFVTFKKHSSLENIDDINRTALVEFVSSMREKGLSASCSDAYVRGINPFLTWLFENELTSEHFKVKRIKFQKKVMKTFNVSQVKAIVTYKPKNYYEIRLHTLLLLLLDCGIRINEALTLTRSNIDFDNLLIMVDGKGNKQRVVPFSFEMRKALFKLLRLSNFELVFASREGGKLGYNNVRRDFNKLIEKLRIEDVDGSFHAFRRCFARNFVRSGGNLFYLQKILGHTTLKMSREYIELETQDIQKEQLRTSLLNRV